MHESNAELTRRFVAAFNARDVETLIACFAPSIEYHSAFAAVGGGVYYGHDGLRRWHRDLAEAWGDEIRAEPETYFDLGETTLLFYVLSGHGKHSGVEVEMPNAAVFKWRDGLGVYVAGYAHREDALSDLGVSEDELEPIEP